MFNHLCVCFCVFFDSILKVKYDNNIRKEYGQ